VDANPIENARHDGVGMARFDRDFERLGSDRMQVR